MKTLVAGCGTRLAAAGYGVFGVDYEGHGRSHGARCYIKKFDNIVNDCDDFFKSICGKSVSFHQCTAHSFFNTLILYIIAEGFQFNFDR